MEHERIANLEPQLSETLVERDRHIAQLTNQLVQKSTLLEQAEANAAEAKKRAGLEQRGLQAKLDKMMLFHGHEQRNLQAKFDELLLSRDQEQRDLQAKLDNMLLFHNREQRNLQAKFDELVQSRDQGQRDLQAKLNELLLSRDQALEQARSALQKASFAAEVNEQSQRELTEMRAELEARKSESAAFHSRLADTAENDCAKSKAEADTYRNQTPTGFVNTDEDRVVHRLMERVRAEMASRRWNEKSIEEMECRNEEIGRAHV